MDAIKEAISFADIPHKDYVLEWEFSIPDTEFKGIPAEKLASFEVRKRIPKNDHMVKSSRVIQPADLLAEMPTTELIKHAWENLKVALRAPEVRKAKAELGLISATPLTDKERDQIRILKGSGVNLKTIISVIRKDKTEVSEYFNKI